MSFDFDAAVVAPFRMQPGLRRPPPGVPRLTPLAPGSRHQREKLAVLGAFPHQAFCARDGFDASPALAALCVQAATEHPGAWRWDGAHADARHLGTAVRAEGQVQQTAPGAFGLGDEIARCLLGLPAAWRLAGLLSLAFAEDFAIVDGATGAVPWLAVTLPSHWAPEEKVGLHFTQIHAPVADNALLLKAADALLRLAVSGEPWERFVWTVSDHGRLHAHPARVAPQRWSDTPPHAAWWRTERQGFIAVPGHAQAVFTIHVDCQPLAQAIDAPGRAAALHDAIASMSPAVLAYRRLAEVRDPLLAWLRTRADADGAGAAGALGALGAASRAS